MGGVLPPGAVLPQVTLLLVSGCVRVRTLSLALRLRLYLATYLNGETDNCRYAEDRLRISVVYMGNPVKTGYSAMWEVAICKE